MCWSSRQPRLHFMALSSPVLCVLRAGCHSERGSRALLCFGLVWFNLVIFFYLPQQPPEPPLPHEPGLPAWISAPALPWEERLRGIHYYYYYFCVPKSRPSPAPPSMSPLRAAEPLRSATGPVFIQRFSSASPQTTRCQILKQNKTVGFLFMHFEI